MQVGKAALGEGAQQVEGGGGLVIGLQQAFRVRHTTDRVETDTVDDVATVGRQGHAVDGFIVGRTRLGELPGHAPDLDHRATGGKGHDDCHLQQYLEGVADLRGGELGETLGAVATLQQERPALGHFSELTTQFPGLAGKHQRRITGQGLLDLAQMRGVGVSGLLLDRQGAPAVRAQGRLIMVSGFYARTAMVAAISA